MWNRCCTYIGMRWLNWQNGRRDYCHVSGFLCWKLICQRKRLQRWTNTRRSKAKCVIDIFDGCKGENPSASSLLQRRTAAEKLSSVYFIGRKGHDNLIKLSPNNFWYCLSTIFWPYLYPYKSIILSINVLPCKPTLEAPTSSTELHIME